jgi:tetratricopeptide (TPR) repeat protein
MPQAGEGPPSSGMPASGLHMAGFRELERALSLADGFVLIPVEVQGPDVARTLAAWLVERGWPTTTIEPTDDGGWQELVAQVMEAASKPARAVLVIGPRQPTGATLVALRLINQRRDSIASAIGRPLLWCGPPEFLKLTWERAPDFWSIRAMTRKLATPSAPTQEAPLWPGAWVADPPERLREMLATARRQGDERNASRVAAMLGEALVARGELEEAAEVVAEARPTPALRMIEAVLAAIRGDRARAEAILEDASWTAGAPELEGRRLLALGNIELDARPASAVVRYEEAARVLHDARDTPNEAIAIANLGVAAIAEGSLEDAEERLDRALSLARDGGDARSEVGILAKLGRVHLLGHDSRRACATLEEAMARLADVEDPRAEEEVLRRLARAYLELGDPEKAEGDARRAAEIARRVGDADGVREAEEIVREAGEQMRGA